MEYNGKNGTSKYIHDYVKPKSPVKGSSGILSHDNVPMVPNGKTTSPRLGTTQVGYVNNSTNGAVKSTNGVKINRNISWNRDIPPEKLSFTMRREFDKAKEESDLIDKLRNVSNISHINRFYTASVSGRFYFNARLKCINCRRYTSSVMVSFGCSNS